MVDKKTLEKENQPEKIKADPKEASQTTVKQPEKSSRRLLGYLLTFVLALSIAGFVAYEASWLPSSWVVAIEQTIQSMRSERPTAATQVRPAEPPVLEAQKNVQTQTSFRSDDLDSISEMKDQLDAHKNTISSLAKKLQQTINQRQRSDQATTGRIDALEAERQDIQSLLGKFKSSEEIQNKLTEKLNNLIEQTNFAEVGRVILIQLLALARQELIKNGSAPYALRLLELADERLKRLDLIESQLLRGKLIQLIDLIKKQQSTDIQGILLRLSALKRQVRSLPLAQDAKKEALDVPFEVENSALLKELWREFRSLVSVERVESKGVPKLSVQHQELVFMSVELALDRMALALSSSQLHYYQQIADSLREQILYYFDDQSPLVESFLETFDSLKSVDTDNSAALFLGLISELERLGRAYKP